MNNPLRKIETDKAPKAIGPYSQAIVAGDYLFASGQIAINPETRKLAEGGIKEQTARVFDNLEAILKEYGIDFSRVVKATVYLKDMKDFAEMNAIYAARFSSEPKPARETVQVAGLPMGALVEISCVAYLGK